MKINARFIIGVFSLFFIALIVFSGIYVQSHTKRNYISKDFPIQANSEILISNDKHSFYQYGYLSQAGLTNNRCAYIGKYDNNGNFLRSILVDNEITTSKSLTEPTFLYESADALYVVLSTLNDNSRTKSIMKLNKNDLSIINRKSLDEQFENVGLYDADESGFLFSNLCTTDSVIKIIRTNFEGKVLYDTDVVDQIHLKYKLIDSNGSHEKLNTNAILTSSVLKLYKDKIYICMTIANKGTPENEFTGVIMCFDNSGNMLWRNDKTPLVMNNNFKIKYDETKYISSYNDIYIEDEKIYIVGSDGKYCNDSDLPKNEQGATASPIVDEYDLNGKFMVMNTFENINKNSRIERILNDNDGFLLLGRNLSKGTIDCSFHQKKIINNTNMDIFINENNDFYHTIVMSDKIIAYIYDWDNYSFTPEIFDNYQQFLNSKRFLSIYRFIQLSQLKIIVVLSIIAIMCFFSRRTVGRTI